MAPTAAWPNGPDLLSHGTVAPLLSPSSHLQLYVCVRERVAHVHQREQKNSEARLTYMSAWDA